MYKQQRGFSLLETIVASLIFAAVLSLASLAFKFFVSNSAKTVISDEVLKQAASHIRFRKAIKGTSYISIANKQKAVANPELFFQGDSNYFTGITTSSIAFQLQPTQYRLFVDDDSSGNKSLLYCEFDMKQRYPSVSNITCDTPIVVASAIDNLTIHYFGWSSLNDMYGIASQSVNKSKHWQTGWDASTAKVLPTFIRIDIDYIENNHVYDAKQLWFRIPDADPVQLSENSVIDE